jgi:hypothetical protein
MLQSVIVHGHPNNLPVLKQAMDQSLDKTEDLLRDATALVERAKIELPEIEILLVFGFRKNGALSLFFGEEIAYHFNCKNELRRAFLYGNRYKTEQRKLMRISRIPHTSNVYLKSTVLQPEETKKLLADLNERLNAVEMCLSAKHFRIVKQVSRDGGIIARFQKYIPELLHNKIAQTPRVDA